MQHPENEIIKHKIRIKIASCFILILPDSNIFTASLLILSVKDIRGKEVDSCLPDIPPGIHQAHILHREYLKAGKNQDHYPFASLHLPVEDRYRVMLLSATYFAGSSKGIVRRLEGFLFFLLQQYRMVCYRHRVRLVARFVLDSEQKEQTPTSFQVHRQTLPSGF